jgi:DNA replication and repair protein RecF
VKLKEIYGCVISQLDSQYLQHLIQYQKLNQRNALLKYFALNRVFENDTLAIYNEQLEGMVHIFDKEKNSYLNLYLSLTTITAITGSQETVQVVYESHLFENNLLVLLQENINKDRVYTIPAWALTKTTSHLKSGHPIKKFGSQGQQKSFLIALKLAQFEFLKKTKRRKAHFTIR